MGKTACAMLLFVLVSAARAASGETLDGVVNLNEASVEQLCLLPRIGPAKAAKIVEFREKRRFRRIEDLVLVPGIGPQTFRRLAPYLAVRGETTLKARGAGLRDSPR